MRKGPLQGYGPGKTPRGLMQIDAHGAGGNGFTARGPLWEETKRGSFSDGPNFSYKLFVTFNC